MGQSNVFSREHLNKCHRDASLFKNDINLQCIYRITFPPTVYSVSCFWQLCGMVSFISTYFFNNWHVLPAAPKFQTKLEFRTKHECYRLSLSFVMIVAVLISSNLHKYLNKLKIQGRGVWYKTSPKLKIFRSAACAPANLQRRINRYSLKCKALSVTGERMCT